MFSALYRAFKGAKDVEQLLGRVLRMPYAKRRGVSDLNKAYAFLSEPSFGEAAKGLTDKLVGMGFEEDEALDNIEQFSVRSTIKPTCLARARS